jgi:hypothetical protein
MTYIQIWISIGNLLSLLYAFPYEKVASIKRKEGRYFTLFRTLLKNLDIGYLKAIIIEVQQKCRSDRIFYSLKIPFLIPIKHEYCLIFRKAQAPCTELGTEPGEV